MTIHLRPASPDDLPAIMVADGRAFGVEYTDEDRSDIAESLDAGRMLLACDDDGSVVGVTGSFPLDVTLPGGRTLPAPGVTWVSVQATHRRRGVLRALFTEQHRGFVENGPALALLTASEGGIYGRFGYGVVTVDRGIEIDRRRAEFRAGVPDPGGVLFADVETARKHAPEVHARWCAQTPGAVARPGWAWEDVWRDRPHHRGGGSALFHLVHADGWASFRRRREDRRCEVVDLFAATDEAHVALWRVLLSLDLVETVSAAAVAPDDALPLLLTDPRQVRTTSARDGMWASVLDVPAALAARTYGTEIDVVLAVDDPFLDRGGRFRLRGGPEGATCEPAGDTPELSLAAAALGPLLFGGQRAHTLARAGLLTGATPDVLRRVEAAFGTDRAPRHGTDF